MGRTHNRHDFVSLRTSYVFGQELVPFINQHFPNNGVILFDFRKQGLKDVLVLHLFNVCLFNLF